jgi:hypothetical protein
MNIKELNGRSIKKFLHAKNDLMIKLLNIVIGISELKKLKL